MRVEIRVPRLGWSMEEGTFAGWLMPEGELVRKGAMLFSLEGDKSTQEVESFEEGILEFLADGPAAGDAVRVGQLIGHLHASTAPGGEPTTTTGPSPGVAAPIASPRARRAAGRLGIDWRTLSGGGTSGRIRERDVFAAAPTAEKPVGGPSRSGPRKIIAERMVASHLATAPVTLFATADATNLVLLRAQFRAAGGDAPPSYSDFVVKFAASALRSHPAFNSVWTYDEPETCKSVNIGIAVDLPTGLVVPVVRDVDRLGLRELAAASRRLIAEARNGRLAADAQRGGTFTVTNLGAEGIDAFTPIINPPQAAILGLGRIEKRPVWIDGAFVPRDVLTLSLTFDHRVADGAPAARFLREIREAIENPAPRLIP